MKFFNKGFFHGVLMQLSEAKPEMMLVSGCASLLAGTIYACTKTEKAKEIVKKHKEAVKAVDESLKLPDEENIDILPQTRKQMKIEKGRQYLKIYAKTTFELVKIYGIPGLLWFGGMGMVVGSHGEMRKINKHLAVDILAGNQLMREYRQRVSAAVGEEVENRIFMGVQEGMVNVVETDENTGEKKVVQKKADVFHAQPGSIFARNFTEETSDAFDIRSFADHYLEARIDEINKKLEIGAYRAFNGMEILRMLGFNENALTESFDDDEAMNKLLDYGISGNARKVRDPEMRKLKVTRLSGYQKKWDPVHEMEVYEPCLRLDFNFYPLHGMI